jgi:hypothetical protein
MLLLFIILFIVSILYIVEVRLGSSSYIYNCELGKASELRETTRLSRREFFSRMLPLLLLALGLPLLFLRPWLGLGLLVLAWFSCIGSYLFISPAHP